MRAPRPQHAATAAAVAEVQGLYGPFSFSEKLLQKIWLRGDFDRTSARLGDGRAVRISHPGKWNLLGGPDFKGARLAFGGEAESTGDVELHLRAGDWHAHGHAADPAYDRVILHVVLFPPEPGYVTRGVGGRQIPVLALLPLLQHDLEEFAAEEAVELLAGQSSCVPEELAGLEQDVLLERLRSQAEKRWRRKVHYAHLRVQRLGWEEACHHTAMEVLGYRFNRAPMLHIAARWPLVEWGRAGFAADEIFASEQGRWSVQGVRPANHPRTRLRQYAAWTQARPDWPARWEALAAGIPTAIAPDATRAVRRGCALVSWRDRIAETVCAGRVGGTRFDNFVCDGLFPLSTARTGAELFGVWFHWFAGDQPPALLRGLRQLGVFDGRAQPVCHGFAQGLFSWFIERESRG